MRQSLFKRKNKKTLWLMNHRNYRLTVDLLNNVTFKKNGEF